MEGLLLATAGDDVRLWTMPDLKLHSVKPNVSGNATYCSCSNNGQMVAYTQEGQGINIASLLDNAPPMTIPTSCEQSNVAFSTNSKYLVSGGLDSVVNIWDVKSKIVKRTYKDHSYPISFTIFNFNGNVVASASTNGDIILTEVQSGCPCQPLRGEDSPQGITCLGYSHFTRYLLASTSNSGTLALWDTKESKLVKSFNEHTMPATCLSFSPLNDMLLCTSGLDKKMIFYDVCYKKIVKTINTDGPVTSCEFMNDGTTVAVGSYSGNLSVFDLRHGSLPLVVIQGHNTAVRSVSFQKFPKERQPLKRPNSTAGNVKYASTSNISVSTPPAGSPMSRTSTDLLSNVNKPADVSNSANKQRNLKRASSYDVLGKSDPASLYSSNESISSKSSVIPRLPQSPKHAPAEKIPAPSPIDPSSPARRPVKREKSDLSRRSIETKQTEEPTTTTKTRRPSFERSRSGLSRFLQMARSSEDVSLLSNKKKEKSSEDLLRGAKKNKESDKEQVVDGKKGLLNLKSPFHKKKLVDYNKNSDESESSSIESFSIEDKTNRNRKNSSVSMDSDDKSVQSYRAKLEIPSSPLITPKNSDTVEKGSKKDSNEAPSSIVTADNVSDEVFMYEPATSSTNSDNKNNSTATNSGNITVKFIERMISESMEENRIAIHNDMMNLQVEFIRQMEIQKNQIQQMLEHYSVKDDLVKEILRLRVENKRLGAKY